MLTILVHVPEPTLNYTNVASNFEEELPLPTFANEYLPESSLIATEPLFTTYNSAINHEEH